MESKDLINENEECKGLIDNKYILLKKEGAGLTSIAFKVKHLNDSNNLEAKVEKILNEDKLKKMNISLSKLFGHEINILNIIKNYNSPYIQYIVNIIESGKGEIIRKNKPTSTHNYIILEYAEKGCLYDYIYFPEKGFREEEYAKLLFFRILLGIKACHEAKICNRDIKLENILLDEKYNPKICYFGFAEINKNEVIGEIGTQQYMATEVHKNKSYNGYQVDIFNFGVSLLIFVTGEIDFTSRMSNDNARLIYKKSHKKF